MKRVLAALGSAFFLVFAAQAEPMEDADYVRITPQPVAEGGRIEVIEFFHYGCEACYRFEPLLVRWSKSLPPDVVLRRVPALRRIDWIPLASVYFALEQLGEIGRLHGEVYRGLHENNLNLGDSTELFRWGQQYGLERGPLESALRSEQTSARIQGARDATVAYGVRATPTLVVDGRYLTSGAMVGNIELLLPVVDGLIDQVRRQRAER